MATFSHQVTLWAVPRPQLESIIQRLHDLLERLPIDAEGTVRLPDSVGHTLAPAETPGSNHPPHPVSVPVRESARLVEGEHLRPGARYLISTEHPELPEKPEEEVLIHAWNRAEETSFTVTYSAEPFRADGMDGKDSALGEARLPERGEMSGAEPPQPPPHRDIVSNTVTLRSIDSPVFCGVEWRPRTVERDRLPSVTVQVDLTRWWEQATAVAPPTKLAPATATIIHRLGAITVRATPSPAEDGHWRLTITTVVKGRRWARPLAWGLVILRPIALRVYRKYADALAEQWNQANRDGALWAEIEEELLRLESELDPPSGR